MQLPSPGTAVPGRRPLLVLHASRLVGQALAALLTERTAWEVVASTWEDGAAEAASLRPGMCVAYQDSGEGGDALAAEGALVRQLRQARCALLVLTCPERTDTLRRALDAGARGFVHDGAAPHELLQAVHEVGNGRGFVAEAMRQGLAEAARMPVTRRELQVLRHAANGSSVGETAAALELAPGTVRNYLGSGVRKFGARNRIEAIAVARAKGWLCDERPPRRRAPAADPVSSATATGRERSAGG